MSEIATGVTSSLVSRAADVVLKEKRRLVLENRQLRHAYMQGDADKTDLVGDSAVMVRLRQTLSQVADADVDVLITGETGVGKETTARALHRLRSWARTGWPAPHRVRLPRSPRS